MTYTRVASGDPGNSGATSAVTIVNAHSDGLEALEAGVVNAAANGVVADTRAFTVTATAGNSTVTATASWHALGANVFSASDVGKAIHINRAGVASAWLRTTVATYISPTQVTVTVAPSTSTSGSAGLVGTDNTATISALCTALAPNESLLFPAAEYWYLTSGGHSVTAPGARVIGTAPGQSFITTSHSTNNVFTLGNQVGAARLSVMHGAYVANVMSPGAAVWPTAGAAFLVDAFFSGGQFSELGVFGCFEGIKVVDAARVKIINCYFDSMRDVSVSFDSSEPDYGMYHVSDCNFAGTPGQPFRRYDILWIKGGGFTVTNCTFEGRATRNVGMVFDGADYTGNIRINNNFFEDFATNAVYMAVSAGVGDLGYISISNNVIQGGFDVPIVLTAATQGGNRTRPGSDHGIAAVSIVGNARYNGSGVMVELTRCRDVAVVGNTQIGGTVLSQTNCLNVRES